MMTKSNDRDVGSGQFRYRALARWEQLPPGWSFGEVAGVAVDSADRIYVFNRGAHPVVILDRDGRFLGSWGEGLFARPHGISIDREDFLWLTDDSGHTVRKFTPKGELLLTLGTSGKSSDTGVQGMDYRTIRRGGPPFNYPTNVAFAADGSLYVTDGYGNARVHHFSREGRLLASWGEPGTGPGQFNVPHGIALDSEGLIYVADRENSRIQVFTSDGAFLDEWTDVARPMQVCIDPADNVFVVDLGWRAGLWPWLTAAPGARQSACLSVFNTRGELLARWGEGEEPTAVGAFFAPHDIRMDSRGDLYVGEVVLSAGVNRGLVSADCHCLQKFVKL
jgi:DNA-binding beta-propeller fold protein YncE